MKVWPRIISAVCLILSTAVVVFSQENMPSDAQRQKGEKPVECDGPRQRAKFHTLFVSSAGAGGLFEVQIRVDPRDQKDENYLAIANQMKAKYCTEDYMGVIMYDSEEHARLGNIPQPERTIEGTPRVLYLIKRTTGKESLQVYKIVNGVIQTRDIDLSPK